MASTSPNMGAPAVPELWGVTADEGRREPELPCFSPRAWPIPRLSGAAAVWSTTASRQCGNKPGGLWAAHAYASGLQNSGAASIGRCPAGFAFRGHFGGSRRAPSCALPAAADLGLREFMASRASVGGSSVQGVQRWHGASAHRGTDAGGRPRLASDPLAVQWRALRPGRLRLARGQSQPSVSATSVFGNGYLARTLRRHDCTGRQRDDGYSAWGAAFASVDLPGLAS
ncbi:hypothetical protein PsYK624_133580 [Phanerochaete sordida]|uniref:Uncharacterized protein n=1 Tax=Phanerochaete sordida TaxID=48140 RepID=A0A9P3GLE3_9APHY|nr:hypothetical protein PsYK624_133580 [Phanerochaete sordida]